VVNSFHRAKASKLLTSRRALKAQKRKLQRIIHLPLHSRMYWTCRRRLKQYSSICTNTTKVFVLCMYPGATAPFSSLSIICNTSPLQSKQLCPADGSICSTCYTSTGKGKHKYPGPRAIFYSVARETRDSADTD